MSFDAGEFFHHRVDQDQYIVYVGMLVAMLYVWIKDILSSDKQQDSLSRTLRKAFPALQYLVIAASILAFGYYFYWTNTALKSTAAFSKLQPYLTITPILTFIILRNAHPLLRNWHSAAFAWLGRYSGEMYVMQNHLWLAVDQESVLRTGFFHGDDTVWGDRWRDLVLITPLYLIACSIVGDATGVIANWFIEDHESTEATGDTKPVAEVEMGLLAGEVMEEDGALSTEEVANRPSVLQREKAAVWPARVRDRGTRVLFVMWLLKILYT
ncbi:putative O-acetyltransferase CAS1 [Fulvia fulva]|uniref:O-acetyltransferase CAS1 n=1 Tax=Passalora fulva TaxID=5499 RepID=A0A9Q8LCV8_PASFU|nr:putative O-acetyltransferase CAS1 [Fulvia fulva]KAK4629330.1 putative O-acetyltransferase CAS1 [Fulvia fulva]KAK4630325.1 putative O-acetyltransferase CAS1 [Fulvia fulva]UJO14889.1 putative O-acetyltransferase CAS1 [Fulvia fulva]WPV13011.1 putative O-acetyltransferase CAS1 [Fulvia fulva]WPV27725.1 putative O-acetyltransferase CAS1 [Fulvia fulva]